MERIHRRWIQICCSEYWESQMQYRVLLKCCSLESPNSKVFDPEHQKWIWKVLQKRKWFILTNNRKLTGTVPTRILFPFNMRLRKSSFVLKTHWNSPLLLSSVSRTSETGSEINKWKIYSNERLTENWCNRPVITNGKSFLKLYQIKQVIER